MRIGRAAVVSMVFLVGFLRVSMAHGEIQIVDLGGDQYQADFRLTTPPGTKSVALAGTFNGWNPTALLMKREGETGVFKASVVLGKGRHEYKFVVDGERWITDPDNPHRTGGYQNAIVYAGIAPSDPSGDGPPPSEPAVMAGLSDHPAAIQRLANLLKTGKAPQRGERVERWIKENPMPFFSDASVSFVLVDAQASAVTLYLDADGVRQGYALEPLPRGAGVFVVSLERATLPKRAAYTYEVEKGGAAHRVVDPNAWSLTSRSGEPAGWVVEASPQRGRIEVVPAVASSGGKLRPRDIYVYLPPGYDADTDRRYPVLYMHDGQNCWDDPVEPFGHGGWCVNLCADELIAEGKIEPFIGVGMANTADRMEEYGPGTDMLNASKQAYLQFVAHQIKPMINKEYRTKPEAAHTAIMGSSMGGLISLQAALLMPEVFGQAACLSPAFRFNDPAGQTYFDLASSTGKKPVRIYMDSGTAGSGQDGAPMTRAMAKKLRELGWQDGTDFLHFEDTAAEHNERAWRARVHRPLAFMFGTEGEKVRK